MKMNELLGGIKVSKEKKEKAVIGFLIGIFFLLIATPVSSVSDHKTKSAENAATDEEQETRQITNVDSDAYIREMENKLEETIQAMEGVGEVEVMITLKNNGEKILEKNLIYENDSEKLQEDGKTEEKSVIKNNPETVLIETSGDTSPIVISEKYPEIEGVLVVCQGGNDADVEVHIKEAVQALFSVDAHKIVVCKRK